MFKYNSFKNVVKPTKHWALCIYNSVKNEELDVLGV